MVERRWQILLLHGPVAAAFLTLAFAPWTSWFSSKVSLANSLASPSAAHPLGTDNLGRDLLVRSAEAIRDGVLPLWGAVALSTVFGIALAFLTIGDGRGGTARVLVGGIDVVATLLASIPVGVSAFAWAVVWQSGGLAPVGLAVSALFAVRSYLQVRDLYRHDQQLAFWTAHQSLGGSLATRLFRYGIASGWRWNLAESFGFHLRAAVGIEASLSYLGFGIQEPQASFGNMLASHFDLYLKGDFHVLAVILAALAVTAAFPRSVLRLLAIFPTRRSGLRIFAAVPGFQVQ